MEKHPLSIKRQNVPLIHLFQHILDFIPKIHLQTRVIRQGFQRLFAFLFVHQQCRQSPIVPRFFIVSPLQNFERNRRFIRRNCFKSR